MVEMSNEIKEKIYTLEEEIQILRDKYARLVEPCQNKDCGYFNEVYKNHCSWTWFVDECPDYKVEYK